MNTFSSLSTALAWTLGVLCFAPVGAAAETILLPGGEKTTWKYYDQRSGPAKNWASREFDDSEWKSGKAPLGYGEDNLGTRIGFGSNPRSKNVTAWFRTKFEIDEAVAEAMEQLEIQIRRDDGAVIYLNGKEIVRSNMPAGPLDATTLATSALSTAQETEVHSYLVPGSALGGEKGPHTIAVELHQANPASSDAWLDLEIKAYAKGEGPVRDFYREGMAAWSRGRHEEAAELLKQMDPKHPEYAETMANLAQRIYAEVLGRGQEGIPLVKKALEMEPDNRNVVRAYIKTHVLSGVLFDDKEIARERPKSVADEYKWLVSKPDFGDRSKKFTRKQMEQDLDYLEHVLVKCFAYLELRDVDYQAALDAIRISLDDPMPVDSFELCLAKLISMFCDGHARVMRRESEFLPVGYAPYLAASYKERIYLLKTSGRSFLDPAHPYVTEIDGKPIAEWMKVAGYLVVKESPQWHRRGCLSNLGYVAYLRAELGLPAKEEITLKLESEDGKQTKELVVPMSKRLARSSMFPAGQSRRIGDVGYIRIPSMTRSPRFLSGLEDSMKEFKDTSGLIIDVRGNTGGTKNVLFTLMPYFLKPGDPLKIVEFSTYRKPLELPVTPPNGYMMSDMSAQPVTAARWTSEAQRKQIAAVIEKFDPTWKLPMSKFSSWHVLALDADTNPRAYYYDKPLIILHDSNSFSASDIFLGGFEDHPNTTLMGTPSGGGNGWMERYRLPNTGIGVVLCQSAKFRPNGKPYDGEGIPPDVFIEVTPDDIMGKGDSVLDAAVKRLSGEKNAN